MQMNPVEGNTMLRRDCLDTVVLDLQREMFHDWHAEGGGLGAGDQRGGRIALAEHTIKAINEQFGTNYQSQGYEIRNADMYSRTEPLYQ
jgi:hypothetical protein